MNPARDEIASASVRIVLIAIFLISLAFFNVKIFY